MEGQTYYLKQPELRFKRNDRKEGVYFAPGKEYRNGKAIESDQETVCSKADDGILDFVWWMI